MDGKANRLSFLLFPFGWHYSASADMCLGKVPAPVAYNLQGRRIGTSFYFLALDRNLVNLLSTYTIFTLTDW